MPSVFLRQYQLGQVQRVAEPRSCAISLSVSVARLPRRFYLYCSRPRTSSGALRRNMPEWIGNLSYVIQTYVSVTDEN